MAIERIIPNTKEWEAFYANHIMRYQFAEKCLEKDILHILDAACGAGYGSHYLSAKLAGCSFVAIDRSAEALGIARSTFQADNIVYLQDDCHTLAAAQTAGPYDVVVSFETLEHLPKPADFVKSCFRNLKSGGRLIISTPNKMVTSPVELNWEFHEKEYTAAEFLNLLQQEGFVRIKLFGQQFNLKGKIKNEIRADLNRLWSNPLVRLGRWIQQTLRGHSSYLVLKETIDDFEIVPFENEYESDQLGLQGPFVLLAVAEKL